MDIDMEIKFLELPVDIIKMIITYLNNKNLINFISTCNFIKNTFYNFDSYLKELLSNKYHKYLGDTNLNMKLEDLKTLHELFKRPIKFFENHFNGSITFLFPLNIIKKHHNSLFLNIENYVISNHKNGSNNNRFLKDLNNPEAIICLNGNVFKESFTIRDVIDVLTNKNNCGSILVYFLVKPILTKLHFEIKDFTLIEMITDLTTIKFNNFDIIYIWYHSNKVYFFESDINKYENKKLFVSNVLKNYSNLKILSTM